MLLVGRGCTNDNSKKKLSLLFLLVLLPLVSAVQIDSGTLIQSVVLNTTLNFTSTFYADSFQTESTFIYFEDFRLTSSGTETTTMNLTNRNMTGIPPYISASSPTSKTITSTLSQSVNATVIVNVDKCPTNAEYDGDPVTYTQCSGSTATFNLQDIPSGSSLLTFDASCDNNESFAFNLIMIFSVLAVLSTCIVLVYNKGKLPEVNAKMLIIVFIMLSLGIVFLVQIANDSASYCPV